MTRGAPTAETGRPNDLMYAFAQRLTSVTERSGEVSMDPWVDPKGSRVGGDIAAKVARSGPDPRHGWPTTQSWASTEDAATPERMAKRGMLPKFRPASLGRDALARPSIRPVKPAPPPPPPSPPRRMSSGFGPRSNLKAFAQTALENDLDDALEASTVAGNPEPSTLNRGPETMPLEPASNARRGRVGARALSFEDETQARPVDDRLLNTLRREDAVAANAQADLGVDYESLPSLEVRRPYDTYEAAFSERDPVTQLHGARSDARVRRADKAAYREPAPAFEEPVYNDAEPETPPYESSYREPEVDEASYREPSYQEPSYPASSHHVAEEQDVWGRREESGPQKRPSPPPPARSYAAPVPSYDDASDSAQWGRDRAQPSQQQHGWSSMPPQADDSRLDQPMIPPAPRLPEEMHPAFVVGVQRIRTATPDAWGTPHAQPGQYLPSPMQAIQSSMPPQYAQNQAYAYQHQYQQQQQQYAQQPAYQHQHQPTAYAQSPQQYLQPGQRQPTPMPMHNSSMSPSMMQRAQPVGGQLLTASPAPESKIGRFAWFVAGAAFGITFAFFATGFFNGGKLSKDESAVAPAATVAATPAAAPTAPPVAGAPAAPVAPVAPVAQAPAAPITPASLPAVTPTANPVSPAAAPPAPPPVVRAAAPAPPRAPRFQAPPPRRPSAPASQAPRNLGGGGPGADDDARPSAPPAPPAGSDLGDLLGAGLKP